MEKKKTPFSDDERGAIALLRTLREVPEAARLDAIALMLRVWIEVPTLRREDVGR